MTKYIVKNPAGEIIGKRSSDRVYTHAIVGGPEKRSWRVARLAGEIALQSRYAASYKAVVDYIRNGGKLTLVEGAFGGSWYMSDFKLAKDDGGSINERNHGKLACGAPSAATEEAARLFTIESYLGYIKNAEARIANLEEAKAGFEAGPEFIGEESVVSFHMSYFNAVKSLNSLNFEICSFEIVEVEVAA
jgi:hypothetical protein